MGVPLIQQVKVGSYILKQKIKRNRHYPLVLMLEPLFRCNLACPGCGKIDYPKQILDKRLSIEDCIRAVDECGAPIVSIAGGEPLIHKDMNTIVNAIIKKKKFVYLCTNALLLEKKMHQYQPSPYLTFSIHLDGLEEEHDKAVDQKGVFKRAVKAITKAVEQGFRVTVNCTLFNNAQPEHVEDFFDHVSTLGIEGITVSPGYAYERAPVQDHFLSRKQTKNLFRDVFRRGQNKQKKWIFNQSSLYLDFLAGNQNYHCTPWGNPTRNIFGWQKPCYLLGEGHVKTYDELIKKTNWDQYGTGKYEKCANCMVHCGYEATAVSDTIAKPWKAFTVWLKGVNTEKPMVEEIPLDNQRPAHYVFDRQVSQFLKQDKAQKTPPCAAPKTPKQDENRISAA